MTSFTVGNIDKVAPAKPIATADIIGPTNQSVAVTATFSADSVTKEYSLDNQNWKVYTTGVSLAENGTVYFRGTDAAGNVSDVTSFTVSNIDKEAPEKPIVSADVATATNSSVTVTAVFSNDSIVKEYSFDGVTWKPYTESIVLTVNGSVSFRGTDEAGNASDITVFTVSNIDKDAPEKPMVSADITAATNQAVTVTAVFDSKSVKNEYSTNGVLWLTYNGGIHMTDNGTVYFRSTDEAGNLSEIASYTVGNIDKTAPDKPFIFASSTKMTNQDVTVTAVFSEDSVLKEYSTDGQSWHSYTEPIIVSENVMLLFRAKDEAGNSSGLTTFEVGNIDREAPEKPIVSADVATATNGSVTVTAVFSEDSVVKEYSTDGQSWKPYTGALVFSVNSSVSFRGADEAGNISAVASYTVSNIDKEAPEKPTASADITTVTNQNVTVTAVFSNDSVTKEYSVDGQTWKSYTESLVLTANGTVSFRGTDAAGNVSDTTVFTVSNIDKVAPEKPVASADVTGKTYLDVTVTAVFSEDSVKKEYSYDGQAWMAYTAALVLSANGSIFFRGADEAGNMSDITVCTVGNILPPQDGPDDGWNDYLYNKKKGGWNTDENISKFAVNTINGTGELNLDEAGSIVKDSDKHNLFGNNGTHKDSGDVAKINLPIAAKLNITISSTAAGTFYVYEDGFDKKGKRKQIKVAKITVKAGKTATLKNVCLTAGNDKYYVAMTAKNVKKAGTEGLYSVNVSKSTFFVDADSATNDKGADGKVLNIGRTRDAEAIVIDKTPMTNNTRFSNFVGLGDSIDYAKIELDSSAYLRFRLTGEGFGEECNGTAKFILWKCDTTGKMTKVGGVTTLSVKNGYSATTKAQFVEAGGKYEYYISMACSDAAKGKGVYYNVVVSEKTVFFDSADKNMNNVLYNKQDKAFYGESVEDKEHFFETTKISVGTGNVKLDSDPVGADGYENFVGYRDAADYAKIELASGGNLHFDLKATGNATFVVYKRGQDKNGNATLDVLQTTKLTLSKGASVVEKTTDSLVGLESGEYYVSMTAKSTKANDKGSVFYNVTATLEPPLVGDALAMPEMDSLGISGALSFDGCDADVLADVSFSSLSALNDKGGWQNIASLA